MPPAGPDRGPRAGADGAAGPSSASTASSISSCGPAGRPPSRATASAIRSGCRAADRLAQSTSSITPGGSASARARSRSSAPRLSSKASCTKSGVEAGRGIGEDQEAAGKLTRAQLQVVEAERRTGLGELDQRADHRRHQQPFALGQDVGIGAQGGRHGDRGQQRTALRSDRHLHRLVLARAGLCELGAAVAQRLGEDLTQPRDGRRGRGRAPTGLELDLQGRHCSTVPACPTPAAEWSHTVMCRASSSATRRAGKRSGEA